MFIVKILIITALFFFFCSVFYALTKQGAKEGAKEVLENLKEAEKFYLLQQKYIQNLSQLEKEYYRLEKNGILEFTDEKGEKRKAEFQKGINVNEFKI
jgi:hypothetical protein